MIHKLTLSIRSIRYACALKPLRSCHHLLSPFICQASDIYLLNVPATYYRCLFFSISFSKIFDSFFLGRKMTPIPKIWSSAVLFLRTLCVQRSEGSDLLSRPGIEPRFPAYMSGRFCSQSRFLSSSLLGTGNSSLLK